MLECSNGSYYTGYTVNIEERYQKHIAGQGSKYTRAFSPVKISACWFLVSDTSSSAKKVEATIKKLPASKKRKLVSTPSDINEITDIELEEYKIA